MRVSQLLLSVIVLSMTACLAPSGPPVSNGSKSAHTAAAGEAAAGKSDLHGKTDLMIFLLIGQSNMVGAPKPEAQDEVADPRVVVLAYDNCPNLGRNYNEWYPAKPPLHDCYGGVGPGDYFGKALAAAYPNATIGLVPLAINGVDIDFFEKGVVSKRRKEFKIPPDNHWPGAYDWVLERARLAQKVGTIRGIIFHQGESDTGSSQWVTKVKTMVTDLRTDLGIGDVPFVAGELLYTGCCGKWHNPLLSQLPAEITNARFVSANGLSGMDAAHFNLAAQRELGKRYGEAMVGLL
jgi:hypothetical protein